MRYPVRFAVLGLSLAVAAEAQILAARTPNFGDQVFFSAGAFGGFPLGDFKKHENGGAGWEIMLGIQPFRRQPLSIRTHFASLIYGNARATGYQDVCDFFGCTTETVEYTSRSHTMNSLHIGPEFFVTDGRFRPFGYAMYGVTWFHSSLHEPPASPNDPSPGSQSLFWSQNASAAYGLGVRFVGTKFGREVGFEIASRVNRNPKASYVTDSSVVFEADGSVTITPTNTAAHVLGVHIGFFVGPYINWNERRPR